MKGYDVTTAKSVDCMLEKMGIPPDSPPDTPPENHFDLYIMELNQGQPNGNTYEPASIIYSHVKELVDSGTVKFLGLSARREVVKVAESAGIPAMDKMEFQILDYLEE